MLIYIRTNNCMDENENVEEVDGAEVMRRGIVIFFNYRNIGYKLK